MEWGPSKRKEKRNHNSLDKQLEEKILYIYCLYSHLFLIAIPPPTHTHPTSFTTTHTFWVFLTWNLISKTDDSGKIRSYTFIPHTYRQTQTEEIHFLCKMKTENLAKIFFSCFSSKPNKSPMFQMIKSFQIAAEIDFF